jgi:hypothetical protein
LIRKLFGISFRSLKWFFENGVLVVFLEKGFNGFLLWGRNLGFNDGVLKKIYGFIWSILVDLK